MTDTELVGETGRGAPVGNARQATVAVLTLGFIAFILILAFAIAFSYGMGCDETCTGNEPVGWARDWPVMRDTLLWLLPISVLAITILGRIIDRAPRCWTYGALTTAGFIGAFWLSAAESGPENESLALILFTVAILALPIALATAPHVDDYTPLIDRIRERVTRA